MHTPRLMLIVFNLILVVTSITTISRGLINLSPELHGFEDLTGTSFFSGVFTFVGWLLFIVTMVGFWCVDFEHQKGLMAYTVVVFFLLGVEVVIILFYSFDETALKNELRGKLNDPEQRDRIFRMLRCCELPPTHDGVVEACCPAEVETTSCTSQNYYRDSCHDAAPKYFRSRVARYKGYTWLLTFPEICGIVFAYFFLKQLTYVQTMTESVEQSYSD